MRFGICLLLVAMMLWGCTSSGKVYTEAELKYLLLDHYDEERFFFCDPDYYPIAFGNETEKALDKFPEIKSDAGLFKAIISRKGISEPYSDEEKLTIYREFKKLRAIGMEAQGSGYAYRMQVGTEQEGFAVSGIIDRYGAIYEQKSEKTFLTCPICLSGETTIGTPDGEINVKDLRQGMMVLIKKADGLVGVSPVLAVSRTTVPAHHRVVHVQLSDGREVFVSGGHPTSDGRIARELAAGDPLDDAIVALAEEVPYDEEYTYDILTAEGGYFANGIYLGSTLKKP